MNPQIERLIEESIEVQAPPAKVWELVTDLPRMASFSPQVMKTWVMGGAVHRGAQTVNLNRLGWRIWPTRSKVVQYDEPHVFAFRTRDNGTIWSYTLEPVEGGTRVIERREAPHGIKKASLALTKAFMGGTPKFQVTLRDGMQETLRRIKAEAER